MKDKMFVEEQKTPLSTTKKKSELKYAVANKRDTAIVILEKKLNSLPGTVVLTTVGVRGPWFPFFPLLQN